MVCTKSSFHKWNDGQWTFDFRAESKSASAANLPSDSRSSRGSGSMTIMFYVVSETEDMIIPEPLRLEWRVEECMELAHPENSDIWLDIMALLDCMPSFPNDAFAISSRVKMSSEASEFMLIRDAEMSNENAADDDEGHHAESLMMLAAVIEKNVMFEELQGLEDASKICTVCQEELQTGVVTGQMPCKHVFHKECIEKWMLRSNNCPVCRFKLPDT
ncbi:hypothetical protein J5N97_025593 [Dioscorea zingiberensis]|uniref:RING-type domain-containing protein n=1 Tax=Dioscorea zingiberensis TaxID=325984 RepID=A0A9D5H5Z9_9LILI|nr:hypothetical protein J5N97_025593 [Dioscorea zingiberensis]